MHVYGETTTAGPAVTQVHVTVRRSFNYTVLRITVCMDLSADGIRYSLIAACTSSVLQCSSDDDDRSSRPCLHAGGIGYSGWDMITAFKMYISQPL